MRRLRPPLLPLAAVALSTWTASCNSPPSVLLVEVAGDLSLMPASLTVTVTAARAAARTFYVAPASGVVSLPASFTVELPGTIVGPITVAISAYDGLSNQLASGTATRQDLDVGGQTILVVTLTGTGSPGEPQPDAGQGGVDAHPETDAHPVDAGMDAHGDAEARDSGAGGRHGDAGGDR